MAGISDKALKTSYAENKYRYNTKELQHQEFSDGSGLEEYDYGARLQDPQLGVWHNIDPKAEKYISGSPYIYASDNPIVMIDPNGKDAVIYDEKGKKVATFHNDKITIEKGMEKSGALAAFQKAVGYVDGKTNTYKDIFGSKSVVNFHVGNFGGDGTSYAKDQNGNALLNSGKDGKMSAQTVDINWDPDKALVTSNGGVNSPALNLLHEAIHGDHLITDFDATRDNAKNQLYNGYDNMEEYNTIQEVNSVAKSIPLESSNRSDHGGKLFEVAKTPGSGVTSILTQPGPGPIDKTRNVLPPNSRSAN
jgi:RHS repeat-associated protein